MKVRDYVEEYYKNNPSAKKNKKYENAQTITQRIMDNIPEPTIAQKIIDLIPKFEIPQESSKTSRRGDLYPAPEPTKQSGLDENNAPPRPTLNKEAKVERRKTDPANVSEKKILDENEEYINPLRFAVKKPYDTKDFEFEKLKYKESQPVIQAMPAELKSSLEKQDAEWKATPFFGMPHLDVALEVGRKGDKLLSKYSPEIQQKLIDIYNREQENNEAWFAQTYGGGGGGGPVGAGMDSFFDSYYLGITTVVNKKYADIVDDEALKTRLKRNELLRLNHPAASWIGGLAGSSSPGSVMNRISSFIGGVGQTIGGKNTADTLLQNLEKGDKIVNNATKNGWKIGETLSKTNTVRDIQISSHYIKTSLKDIGPIAALTEGANKFFSSNLGSVIKQSAIGAAKQGGSSYATGLIAGSLEAIVDGETSPEAIIDRALSTGERYAVYGAVSGLITGAAEAITNLPDIRDDIDNVVKNSKYFTKEDASSLETLKKTYREWAKTIHPDVSGNPFDTERMGLLNNEYTILENLLNKAEKYPSKDLIDKALYKIKDFIKLFGDDNSKQANDLRDDLEKTWEALNKKALPERVWHPSDPYSVPMSITKHYETIPNAPPVNNFTASITPVPFPTPNAPFVSSNIPSDKINFPPVNIPPVSANNFTPPPAPPPTTSTPKSEIDELKQESNAIRQEKQTQNTPVASEAVSNSVRDKIVEERNNLERSSSINSFINAVDPKIVEFVNEVKASNGKKIEPLTIGYTTDKHVSDLKNLNGRNYEGYKIVIDDQIITHINKDHGLQGISDTSMKNIDDIARIPYILENYDNIMLGEKSKRFSNSDGSRADIVLMNKKINGYFYVLEAVPDSKNKTIRIVSAYQNKNNTISSGGVFPNNAEQTANTDIAHTLDSEPLDSVIDKGLARTQWTDTNPPSDPSFSAIDTGTGSSRDATSETKVTKTFDTIIPQKNENVNNKILSRPEIKSILDDNAYNYEFELSGIDDTARAKITEANIEYITNPEIDAAGFINKYAEAFTETLKKTNAKDYSYIEKIADGKAEVAEVVGEYMRTGTFPDGVDAGLADTPEFERIAEKFGDIVFAASDKNARARDILNSVEANDINYSLENNNAGGMNYGTAAGQSSRSGGGNILPDGDMGRETGEYTGELPERMGAEAAPQGDGGQTGKKSRTKFEDYAGRSRYARDVELSGRTSQTVVKGTGIKLIDEAAHNNEMKNIANENKSYGIENTRFFIGEGKNLIIKTVNGMLVNGRDIYVRYDHPKYTPEQINKHELTHKLYDSGPVKKFTDDVVGKLSKGEKDAIIYFYHNADMPSPAYAFEEYICDVMSGMTEYTPKTGEDDVARVWNEITPREKAYDAADYPAMLDAGGGLRYSQPDNETSSIKDQIRDKQDTLNNMSIVKSINGTGTINKNFADTIIEEFKKIGFKVERKNFGDIIIDEKRIKESLRYSENDAEKLAYYAIPSVLKHGIEVGRHTDHKERGYPTVTFASPVEVNGKRGNMGVVVKQMGRNFYKMHRILTPDGKIFTLDEIKNTELMKGGGHFDNKAAGASPNQSVSRNAEELKGVGQPENIRGSSPEFSASNNSIPQKNENVNTILPENEKDIKFSLEKPVEQIKDLVALHNLSQEQLKETLNLGGFAMPSIAVMRSQSPHGRYGDVTVVFGADTINPANRQNEVYGGDAYTPTFPDVGYEIDAKKQREIEKRIEKIVADNGLDRSIMPDVHPETLTDHLQRNAGDVKKAYINSDKMRVAFLADKHTELLDGEKDYYKLRDKAPEVFKDGGAEITAEYTAWLDELFGDLYARRGIRNNRDRFDRNGNRRSFKALHDEYSLDNIIKAMAKFQPKTGGGAFAGTGAVIGASAKRYGSIDEIRADKRRLQKLSEAEYAALKDNISQRLDDVMVKMAGRWEPDIYDVITESLNKSKNPIGLARALNEYSDWYDITPDTVKEILSITKDAAELPTEYFEAKPRRAVGIDEIKAVILPDSADADLVASLENKNVPFVTYEENNVQSRVEAVNSIPEVKFSNGKQTPTEIFLRANLREGKVYPFTASKQVTEGIVNSTLSGDNRGIILKKKDIADISKITHELLNSHSRNMATQKKDEMINRLTGEIARGIIDKAVVESGADAETNDYFDKIYTRLSALKKNLDISEGQEKELQYAYDGKEAKAKLRQWSGGTLPPDIIYMELSEAYPREFPSDIINDADQLIQIIDTYDTIQELRNQPVEYLKDVLDDNTAGELTENIKTYIFESLTYDGRDSKVKQIKTQAADRAKKAIDRIVERKNRELDEIRGQREKERRAAKDKKARDKLLKVARRLAAIKTIPEFEERKASFLDALDLTSKGMRDSTRTELENMEAEFLENTKEYGEDYLPDKRFLKKLNRLYQKQINDLTKEDVQEAIEGMLQLKHEIQTHNILINDAKNREVITVAREVMKELDALKGIGDKEKGKPVAELFNDFHYWQLSPERFFNSLGGWRDGAVSGLDKMLYDGQTKMLDFQMKSDKKMRPFLEKNKKITEKWQGNGNKTIDTGKTDDKGKKVFITPGMRIQMYLHNKAAVNKRRAAVGGLTIYEDEFYNKGNLESAKNHGAIRRFKPSEMAEITSKMTAEEKEFADLLYDYYNVDSKNALNEMSLALYGYEIAAEPDYVHIPANDNYTRQYIESGSSDGTIEGSGILKSRREDAVNPIILEDAITAYERHRDQVAKIVGFAIPIHNFNRIYNATLKGNKGSVKQSVADRGGTPAKKYIKQLISDLQFPHRPDKSAVEKAYGKIRSNVNRAILELNIAVPVKQFTSLAYAADVLGFDSIAASLTMPKPDHDLIDEYTPYMWNRRQGNIDVELGDIAAKQGFGKKLPRMLNLIQKADVATSGRIWNAAEAYVNKHHKDLEKGSPEYNKKTAEMFNKAMRKTQTNYTAMERPPILRSDNEITKTLTRFSTQRFQVHNMAVEAIGKFRRGRQDYKDGKTGKDEYGKAKFAFAATAGAVVAGLLADAIVNLLNNLFTQKGKRYTDEDGEFTAESVFSEIGYDVLVTLSSPFGMPELIEGARAAIEGNRRYDIQNPTIDSFNKLFNSTDSLFAAVREQKNIPGATRAWAKNLSGVLGIPLNNVERYSLGVLDIINRDYRRNYELFFNPNLPVSTKEFWGEDSKAVETMKEVNGQISEANKDLPVYNRIEPVKLPLHFKSFTLGKQEYILTLAERLDYEKQLKEGIEKELAKINTKPGKNNSTEDIRKKINSAVNGVQDALKEKYAVSKAVSDDDYLGISGAANKYADVKNIFTPKKYQELCSMLKNVESTKDKSGKTIAGSLKDNRYKALTKKGVRDSDARKLLTALYGYTW